MRPFALIAAQMSLIAACASTPAPGAELFPGLEQAGIEVRSATGMHHFLVWIAANDRTRARGLMFVRELAPDRGMLFLFEFPQELAFWMKDTYLSLDLIFIDETGKVLNIAPGARPLSLDPIESRGPAVAVLEVLAGTARKIGLAPGDQVTLPGLRTTFEPSPIQTKRPRASRAAT